MKTASNPLYYADYLQLERLLSCQLPESDRRGRPAHDEMLFIIVHQAYELWFKQILFEIDSILELFGRDRIDESDIGVAVARLRRITEIQKILVGQLSVLETMTPLDFLEFRDFLFPASGFQSWQFRLVENRLGLRPDQRHLYAGAAYHAALGPEHRAMMLESEKGPSLADLTERWLERTPFLDFEGFRFLDEYSRAVHAMLESEKEVIRTNPRLSAAERDAQLADFAGTEEGFEALLDESKHRALVAAGERRLSYRATLAALFINLYRDQPILQLPFRYLTLLVEVDVWLTTWRHRHALMVQRMIGSKIGTGGSSGHVYLRATAEKHKIFSDLAGLSTYLIPRSALPELPAPLRRNLGFHYDLAKDTSAK